jgi:hypothetical protein
MEPEPRFASPFQSKRDDVPVHFARRDDEFLHGAALAGDIRVP